MNREVISSRQLIALIFTMIASSATLIAPTSATKIAEQDGWLVPLIGGLFGIITVLIINNLANKYPTLTLFEYSEKILGKLLGKIINLIFILYLLQLDIIIVRGACDTISENILTPEACIGILIVLFFICSYVVKKGLEVITRMNIVILITTFSAMFICLFLLIKDMKPEFLAPVLSNGISPVLKASIPSFGWFTEIFILAFIIPFINEPKDVLFSSIIGIVWTAITLSFFIALDIMIFGAKLTSNFFFPVLEAVRTINIADYIERIEVVFLIPWVMAYLIKLCLFFYVTVFAISKWLYIKNMNSLVLPIGLFIFSLSAILFNNIVDVFDWIYNVWLLVSIIVQFFLILLLLIVSYIKGIYAK